MAKITAAGDPHWQHHVKNYCGYCGAEYYLEPDDKYDISTLESGQVVVRSTCPTCMHAVQTRNPKQPFSEYLHRSSTGRFRS